MNEMNLKKFDIICKKCGSKNCSVSIIMYDSCDSRDVTCNDCKNWEPW